MGINKFIFKHGKTTCDAMFAQLEAGGKKDDGPQVDAQGEAQAIN